MHGGNKQVTVTGAYCDDIAAICKWHTRGYGVDGRANMLRTFREDDLMVKEGGYSDKCA